MKTLLALDNVTTHKTSKVKDKMNECETALSVIPSALTWRPQPLDISFSKVFKESLSSKYVGYWIWKKFKVIKKFNHRTDWWTMVFRFCYNQ